MLKFDRFLLLIGLFLSASVANALELRLESSIEVKAFHRGELAHVGTLPGATIISIDEYDTLGPTFYETKAGHVRRSRGGWVRLKRVENSHIFRPGSLASDVSFDINRNSRREDFFVSEQVFEIASRLRTEVRTEVIHSRPVTRTDVYVDNSFNSYDVCYVQPRNHLVTIKEDQARRGRRNTAIGVGIGVVGILLGGSNDRGVQNLGTAMTIGGAVLATVGLVQWSDSKSVVTTYDERCDRFYTRDTVVREVYLDGRRCHTERYYSRSWDREVEYFQTTCSGARYYSFERHSQIW